MGKDPKTRGLEDIGKLNFQLSRQSISVIKYPILVTSTKHQMHTSIF